MRTKVHKDVRNGLIAIAAALIMTVIITYQVVIFMGTVCKPKTEQQK